MDPVVAQILRGIAKLTPEQRKEIAKSLKGVEIGGTMDEALAKDYSLIMGPTGKPCPVCGK